MMLMEIQKVIEGVQNIWKGELTEGRDKYGPGSVCEETQVDVIFRLQIYMKYKCLNTKLGNFPR